jgi:hypothetical protein
MRSTFVLPALASQWRDTGADCPLYTAFMTRNTLLRAAQIKTQPKRRRPA